MIYATSTDLESYVTATWLDELDDDVVTMHLADASALIDSYVGQVKTLPIITGNRTLTRACCILARWQLILHRGINTDSNYSTYYDEYNGILQWLDAVSKGRLGLEGVVDSSNDTGTTPGKGLMVFSGKEKRWG